jgi:hypothetical protein
MVVYSCNPCTQEAEAEGSQILGQPVLHRETVSQKQQKTSASHCPLKEMHISSKALACKKGPRFLELEF